MKTHRMGPCTHASVYLVILADLPAPVPGQKPPVLIGPSPPSGTLLLALFPEKVVTYTVDAETEMDSPDRMRQS